MAETQPGAKSVESFESSLDQLEISCPRARRLRGASALVMRLPSVSTSSPWP